MTNRLDTELCPPDRLQEVLQTAGQDDAAGLNQLDHLLAVYRGDARLHFLKGSLQAGLQNYDQARESMSQAVALAPDFALARFQLGLLALSSGDPDAALVTWEPLQNLTPDHALRLFARGLQYLIADDFPAALETLRLGIASNTELPVLNRDMQMVIDEALAKSGSAGARGGRARLGGAFVAHAVYGV